MTPLGNGKPRPLGVPANVLRRGLSVELGMV
jgi:hypothetical protein